MEKYNVYYTETFAIEVEADSEEEALEKGLNSINETFDLSAKKEDLFLNEEPLIMNKFNFATFTIEDTENFTMTSFVCRFLSENDDKVHNLVIKLSKEFDEQNLYDDGIMLDYSEQKTEYIYEKVKSVFNDFEIVSSNETNI